MLCPPAEVSHSLLRHWLPAFPLSGAPMSHTHPSSSSSWNWNSQFYGRLTDDPSSFPRPVPPRLMSIQAGQQPAAAPALPLLALSPSPHFLPPIVCFLPHPAAVLVPTQIAHTCLLLASSFTQH